MRIVIFGATGGTGRKLVEVALARGHDVVAAVRKPEAIQVKHERLYVQQCDVLNAAAVQNALTGGGAAISAIGPANNRNPGTLISDGVRNIIHGCVQAGVGRFIFESGLMVGDGRGLSFFGKLGVSVFRSLNRKLCEDKRIAENAIRATGLDWVIVRPPTLADLPPRGDYKFGPNARINAAKKLSHADAADFMVKLAEDSKLNQVTLDIGR